MNLKDRFNAWRYRGYVPQSMLDEERSGRARDAMKRITVQYKDPIKTEHSVVTLCAKHTITRHTEHLLASNASSFIHKSLEEQILREIASNIGELLTVEEYVDTAQDTKTYVGRMTIKKQH